MLVPVLVRNGLTNVQAIEAAIGCRPDHEFVSIRGNHTIKGHPKPVRLYKCTHKECLVERHIRRTQAPTANNSSGAPLVLHEVVQLGTHKHKPITRAQYYWSEDQLKHLSGIMASTEGSHATPSTLFRSLAAVELMRGTNKKLIRGWLKRYRTKKKLPVIDTTIHTVQTVISEIKRKSLSLDELTCDQVNVPFILPLYNTQEGGLSDYLVTGNAVPGAEPQVTKYGTKFAYCIPMTTRKLLGNMQTCKTVDIYNVDKISIQNGAQLTKRTNKGLAMLDGTHKAVRGNGCILVYSTNTRNGHFRGIAWAMVSSETNENILAFKRAVDAAYHKIFGKGLTVGDSLGRVKDAPPTVGWLMTDSGSGMVKAVDQLPLVDGRASCFVHLIQDKMPTKKSLLTNRGNYKKIRHMITRIRGLPPPWFDRAWTAVHAHWCDEGEVKFMRWLKTEHVVKNGGWMTGKFGLGLPSHNNALERNNRSLNDLIRHELRKGDPNARLPASVETVTRAMFSSVLYHLSNENGAFERYPELSPSDERAAAHLAKDPLFVALTHNVYIIRQKTMTGPLHRVSKQMASAAVQILSKQTEWSYEEVKRVTSVRFVTPTSCFPCAAFGAKMFCYHQIAVRNTLGLESLARPTADIISAQNRRGRPRDVKKSEFTNERLRRLAAQRTHKKRKTPPAFSGVDGEDWLQEDFPGLSPEVYDSDDKGEVTEGSQALEYVFGVQRRWVIPSSR